ncbi:MAG: hypothetical protein RDU25_00360 [Patescibacteria group bacterium]|nr:hypothetical protein [Patescibacteria group bacterium]
MPNNFTERRCHLTTSNPPTSNTSGRPSNRNDSRPILGFAATSRYLGCAVILKGEIVALKTRRIARGSGASLARIIDWAAGSLERFCPVAVALLDEAIPDSSPRTAELTEAVHRAAARCNLVPVETCRAEIATALRLSATTAVAVRLELARRSPFVAAHVSREHARSESDRYWGPAVLGAAAALAVAKRDESRRP